MVTVTERERKKQNKCRTLCVRVCLPVKAVLGTPVLGHRACRGCRGRGNLGLAAGCPEAVQHSHRDGRNHLTLNHRDNLFSYTHKCGVEFIISTFQYSILADSLQTLC